MDENPSILAVGSCGISSNALGVLSFGDGYTGRELNSLNLVHSIVQVIPLPLSDSTEQHLHLLVDKDGRAHLYPKTPEATSIFQQELSNIYWYPVGADNGIIKGYTIKSNCIGETYSSKGYIRAECDV